MPTWREDALAGATLGLLIFLRVVLVLVGVVIGSDLAPKRRWVGTRVNEAAQTPRRPPYLLFAIEWATPTVWQSLHLSSGAGCEWRGHRCRTR
jgi:hypothetical protein